MLAPKTCSATLATAPTFFLFKITYDETVLGRLAEHSTRTKLL